MAPSMGLAVAPSMELAVIHSSVELVAAHPSMEPTVAHPLMEPAVAPSMELVVAHPLMELAVAPSMELAVAHSSMEPTVAPPSTELIVALPSIPPLLQIKDLLHFPPAQLYLQILVPPVNHLPSLMILSLLLCPKFNPSSLKLYFQPFLVQVSLL